MGFCCDLREENRFEDLSTLGRIIIKRISKKWRGTVWSGLTWHTTETGGGLSGTGQ
jgi:hypothetical protein